ncbi:MAG: HPr family phosphocarrier protein [Syntrophales bacterium]|nr:HPr family phosphocarrier protein [Syntrophales bacterium]
MLYIEKTFAVKNRFGIHARAAAKIAQTAEKFRSRIIVEYDGKEVNGKSLLDILTLACPFGGYMTIKIHGPDAEDAMSAIAKVFEERFGED